MNVIRELWYTWYTKNDMNVNVFRTCITNKNVENASIYYWYGVKHFFNAISRCIQAPYRCT